MRWLRSHLKIVLPVGVALTAVVGYLAIAVFGVHTLFIDDEVDEAGPVFASGAVAEQPVAEQPITDAPAADQPVAEQPVAEAPVAEQPDAATETAPAEPTATAPAEPVVVTLVEGSFIPRGRYSGEGRALVLNDGSEQRFLRFEDFATDNGPDLNVYLTTADAMADENLFDDPGEFVDLGDLRGNIGEQNYEIPVDVDLERFDTVVVWCVRFGSAFTAADLLPTGA